MNNNQRYVLWIGIALVVLVFISAPHYYIYGDNKVRCESSHPAAQIDIGKTFSRIFIICLITGGVMLAFKSPTKR